MLHMMHTHTIVGHIFGTNVDKYTNAFVTYDTLKNKLVTLLEQMENTHIQQDSFRFGHTHRLYSFLVVTVAPYTQNELLQRIPSYT